LLSFVEGCVLFEFRKFSNQFFLCEIFLASPKNIGMHNFIPEYASTTNISTTPPFHIHGIAMFIPSKERFSKVPKFILV
jgi:hypothetical protein